MSSSTDPDDAAGPAADEQPEPPEPTTPPLSNPKRDSTEAVTWGVRVAASWTWRLLVLGLGLYILTRIFLRVELVAFSLVIALFLTAVLHPMMHTLERLPGRRSVAAGLALLIGIAALVGIGWFVTWQITSHSADLGDQINDFVDRTRSWLTSGPLHLNSADLTRLAKNITDTLKAHQATLITGAIETVRTVAEALGALLLILLATFFLLRDGEEIWSWVLRLFPRQAHERMDVAGRAGWYTLGGYMRGQLLIALFHGTSVFIVLLVVRVPLAGALAVLIFLGSFVPLIGLTIAGALATGVALLEHGIYAGLAVAIAIILLVQIEAHLLQPLIMSRTVKVHPLAIAVSVLTGTILSGIVGALLAVPLIAFLNATIHALRDTPALPARNDFPVAHKDTANGESIDPVQQAKDDTADG